MQIIFLVAVLALYEIITRKTVLDLVIWLLGKAWAVIEWVIMFFTNMLEPPGSKT